MPRWFVRPAARSSSAVKPFSLALAARPRPGESPRRNSFAISSPSPRPGEILAHRLSRGPFPEVPLEEDRRLLEQREEPLASPARLVRLRRDLLVLERDAEPLREPLDRADEVEPFGLADEGDDVAALAAAEAVVEVEIGVDGEARGALLVERAATRVARSRSPSGATSAAHDLDDVRGGDDFADALILDPRHYAAPA